MRYILFIFILWYHINGFSQKDVYFYKDVNNSLTLKEVKEKPFQLLENQISEGYTNATYWFKIPTHKTTSKYVFRLAYDRYNAANIYQEFNKAEKLSHQRYLTYRFSRDNDVYIQIIPKLHSYFPIEFDTEEVSFLKQKHQLILNCFYYGVVFVIIFYNLFYYILFKDDAFLYYALFLGFTCLGIYTMDGMLNFYDINQKLIDVIVVLNYTCLAYFSSKFVNSYLFLDKYYPHLKKYSYVIGGVIITSAILYYIFKSYYYFLTLNALVFLLLLSYWIVTILLFNKNFYNKILALAYVLILFSGIDYFILKLIGFSIFDINAINIKIGAFLEMTILSFAVLYRMKALKKENDFMRERIISYSLELKNLSEEISDEKQLTIEKLETVLSLREDEIFQLIVAGKSNKEIGDLLNISVNTVKFHVKNIYEKLQIKSRKEALVIAKNQHL
ncbi:LuxR C-terminal-related transcriptional regulator [Polaribacter staleyi]|uniref:LuxR C-terminal-related transcriptional regulator n=1 Tax=Polaribacter staleyi TaxID=2022337 RepID=UPI0031BA6834